MKFATVVTALSYASASAFDLTTFFQELNVKPDDTIVDIGKKILVSARENAESYLAVHPEAVASDHPYFNFMPMIQGRVLPDGADVTWSSKCFAENTATAKTQSDGTVQIVLTSSAPVSETCSDLYWLLTVTGHQEFEVKVAGDSTFTWTLPADVTEAEKWDLATKGIRFMEFMTDRSTSVANLLETVLLFVPEFTKNVDPKSAQRNVDFMATYPKFTMTQRDPLSNLPPPAEKVHSGDFFGIIRLDGLDPMLAWAMGSTTGHTTVALWIDGELYICESTVTDSYWPTNGIQKTPYKTWLKQAEEAGYNVVHVPLNAKSRKTFNTTNAIDFFNTNEGLDYGYINMLWGWVDTIKDNYPCVPDDYSSVCLQFELVESLFAIIDRTIPQISDLMWNPAWNKRLGTGDLSTADIYFESDKQGIDARVLPTIVEQDDWLYNTTRNGEPAVGKSMVCCVFVCNIWKVAGLFGDMPLNCAEMTNLDDYSLTIFEDTYEQIIGRWTLNLNKYGTKDPYAHMAETCASLAPNYEQDPHC